VFEQGGSCDSSLKFTILVVWATTINISIGGVRVFLWNDKSDDSDYLADELLSCTSVERLQIATAYFSKTGLEILVRMIERYNLRRDKVTIFLGSSFSMNAPHELLFALDKICETRIVFNRAFHPKVYYLQGIENKLIFGSANFTNGGLSKNIEFFSKTIPNEQEAAYLRKFFAYCRTMSTPLNPEIISFYKSNSPEIARINKEQNKLIKKLSGYLRQDDPFSIDDYNLTGHYFQFDDYETFFPRNSTLNHSEIRGKRKSVQEKMLAIHKAIYPHIEKLDISCHKREENITSMIIPCVYNQFDVGWNGVRYGKTPKEIDALNFAGDKDDLYQFQKHGCIQYCITGYGFEVNLFLAVKNDAVDRYHMHEQLKKLKPSIENELVRLSGHELRWVINDDTNAEEYIFEVDERNANEFCDYFKEYDRDGCESFLLQYYEPDDERISSFESICSEIVEKVELLLPLYNAIVYRPNV